jgi:hypothetical protein
MGKRADLTEKFESKIMGLRSTAEIESDIAKTRAGLEETIDEIKEQFSSEHLKGQVRDATIGRTKRMMKDKAERAIQFGANAGERAMQFGVNASEKAKQLGASVMETVKTNPYTRKIAKNPAIPAALIGVAIGWFLMEGLKRSNGNGRRSEKKSKETSEDLGFGYEMSEACGSEEMAHNESGEMFHPGL